MKLILMAIALVAGSLIPIQGAVNAKLGKALNHPMQATFVSFFSGLLLTGLILLVLRPALPTGAALAEKTMWYDYIGGPIGVIFVTSVLMLTPRIGIANVLTAALAGQMMVSVAIDHFGVLGVAQQEASPTRLLGAACLMAGVWLVQKAPALPTAG